MGIVYDHGEMVSHITQTLLEADSEMLKDEYERAFHVEVELKGDSMYEVHRLCAVCDSRLVTRMVDDNVGSGIHEAEICPECEKDET